MPLAIGFHAATVALIVIYSLIARDILPPPQIALYCSPVDFVPVELAGDGGGGAAEKPPPEESESREAEADPAALRTPAEIPSEIPEAGPSRPAEPGENGPGGKTGTQVLGWIGSGAERNPQLPAEPEPRLLLPADGGEVSAVRLLKQVQPKYPDALRSMRIQGQVTLMLVIDEGGRVESVEVLNSSNDLFAAAAVAAVKGWLYSAPTSMSGARVAVYKRVTVNFVLG